METSILIRQNAEIPLGVVMDTEVFGEGWNLARSVDSRRLENTIHSNGWNLFKIGDELFRCGVGDTSREATEVALRQSLGRVNEHFNAVEVTQIEITQYPWFCLSRVQIAPFRIQRSALLVSPFDYQPNPIKFRKRRMPDQAVALYRNFGCAMPQLKQMLMTSITAQRKQL